MADAEPKPKRQKKPTEQKKLKEPSKAPKKPKEPKRPKPTRAVLQRMLNAARAFHQVSDLPTEPLSARFADEAAAREALVDATLFEAHKAFAEPISIGNRDPTLHALDLGSLPGIVADPAGKRGVEVFAEVDAANAAKPKRAVKKRGCLQAVTSAAKLEERRAREAEERKARPKKPRAPRAPKDPTAGPAPGADQQAADDAAAGPLVGTTHQPAGTTLEPAAEPAADGDLADPAPSADGNFSNPADEPTHDPAAPSSADPAPSAAASAATKPKRPKKPKAPPVEDMIVVAADKFGDHDLFESPTSWVQQLRVLAEPEGSLDERLTATLLQGTDTGAVQLVVGPPGTGKSVELLRRVAGSTEGRRLVTAPTNLAVADLYRRYVAGGGAGASLVMRRERVPGEVPEGRIDPEEAAEAQLVFATAATVTLACMRRSEPFAHVFVDEAGMLPEAAAWCLLRPGTTRLVLCGDPAQLEAVASEEGARLGFNRSLFRRLLDLGHPAHQLTVQRRMHPEIAALTVDRFYGGRVTTEYTAPDAGPLGAELGVVAGSERAVDTSFANDAEAVEAAKQARLLADSFESVVILCPYSAQVARCREEELPRCADGRPVEVASVDSFQGREADAVVLTMVRNGRRGFWASDERMCVAMTRARHRLVILAAPEWSRRDLTGRD